MVCQIEWSPTARFDLWDILSYISEFDQNAAARFRDKAFDLIERLIEDYNDLTVINQRREDPKISLAELKAKLSHA